jgi:glutamate--cysteine ligase catalytic subunit
MAEIFCGKGDYFPGLLPLVYAYLDFINCDRLTYTRVKQYLQFIEKYVVFMLQLRLLAT